MNGGKDYVAVIGDVVGSRSHPDRAAIQPLIQGALSAADQLSTPVLKTAISVGDEFQGIHETVSSALRSTLVIKAHLQPSIDVRFGIGYGPLVLFDKAQFPYEQDGPAWWAAREALEAASKNEKKQETPRTWKSVFRTSQPTQRESRIDPAIINALLICRDQIIATMSERDMRLLRGRLANVRQADLAAAEGISQSAISQRLNSSGINAIIAADLESQRAHT